MAPKWFDHWTTWAGQVVVERITVIEFRMNGGGDGACCGGIKVRADTMKLSNMVIASFGDG